MPARTGVALSITWHASLSVLNQEHGNMAQAQTEGVGITAVGCYGGWSNDGGVPSCEGWLHYVLIHTGTGPSDPNVTDLYYPFRLRVFAPGTSTPPIPEDERVYFLKVADGFADTWPGFGGVAEVPGGSTLVDTNGATATVEITLTGVYAKMGTEDASPAGRGSPMDYTDRSGTGSWHADEGSEVTVTATGPDSTVLSATGPLAEAGTEFELGQNFSLVYLLSLNSAPTAQTVYARISPEWDGEAVDLSNLDLWYVSGGATNPPDGDNPNWGRDEDEATDPPRYHILDDGGLAIRSETAAGGAVSWGGWTQAPWLVTFKAVDGMFADA